MRRLLVAAFASIPLAFCSPAGALTLSSCPHDKDFRCGVVSVPLDPSGAVQGTIDLHIAEQAKGPAPIMVALSGGPGQSSVAAAQAFEQSLKPIEGKYRIVVLDQRGTGQSDVLNCPALQQTPTLAVVAAQSYADCANELGPHRTFFTTANTVLDLDAVRQALGVDQIGLMGVSYGTFVAQQYARTFPTHVSRLILDSVVPAAGIDPFSLDTYARLDRIFRDQCAGTLCQGITRDLTADVASLDQRLQTSPLRAVVPNATGQMTAVTLPNAAALINLIVEGDLNPFLQAAVPSAVAAALDGDNAPLARLVRIANGAPTKLSDLSAGLNATTACADTQLPYSIQTTPIADRTALINQALAAIPATSLGPVDRQTALVTSLAENCADWPNDPFVPESSAPLPDVPALILDGELDMRTPMENGAAVAKELPHASRVVVPGIGHDELDSDVSGCTVTALRRWIDNDPVGDPCLHADAVNQVLPFVIPPGSLNDLRTLPHTSGPRGRLVSATLLTLSDGFTSLEQTLFAGFTELRGGGLRAGHFSGTLAGTLKLDGYSYIPGVKVSGTLRVVHGLAVATLHADGPGKLDGTVRFLANGAIRGTIEGKSFSTALPGTPAAKSSSKKTAHSARALFGGGPSLSAIVRELPRARRAWLDRLTG